MIHQTPVNNHAGISPKFSLFAVKAVNGFIKSNQTDAQLIIVIPIEDLPQIARQRGYLPFIILDHRARASWLFSAPRQAVQDRFQPGSLLHLLIRKKLQI